MDTIYLYLLFPLGRLIGWIYIICIPMLILGVFIGKRGQLSLSFLSKIALIVGIFFGLLAFFSGINAHDGFGIYLLLTLIFMMYAALAAFLALKIGVFIGSQLRKHH